MQKIWVLTIVCLSILTSCTAAKLSPSESPPEKNYQTTSGTIYLEASSEDDGLTFPEEKPSALDGVILNNTRDEQAVSHAVSNEVRAVWFSYFEFQQLLTGRNKEQFRLNIADAFDKVKEAGFNTVFVQVRPYGDALYPSSYFPWSHMITGEEGKDPGFDPLDIMVNEAKARGLRIEAWINPYRVRSDSKKPLSADSPASKWLKEENDNVLEYNGGIYFNPASQDARQLIVNGVREIVEHYDVDGIHFDDYFYPTTSAKFDAESYRLYQEGGGTMSLGNWRRDNVDQLIHSVYAAVKAVRADCLFGISPQGNNDNNYSNQYLNTAKLLATPGYVDYICPQIYFGFENTKAPYKRTVEEWNNLIQIDSIKLYVGLAPYKIGYQDEWAGEGADEWIETTDILSRMVAFAREQSHYGGIAMFRYQSLFLPDDKVSGQVQKELQSLKAIF